MEISVYITRESVYTQVGRRMEWEGTRGPLAHDEYGRISISGSDSTLLHSLFDEAAMHAVDIFRPFLSSVSNTDEALLLKVSLPDDADDSGLSMTVGNMLASHVLALWREIVNPERADAAYAKRDDYASKVQSILYHHRAPVRH